jgi:DNA-binding NarL/FixJ family response regulator
LRLLRLLSAGHDLRQISEQLNVDLIVAERIARAVRTKMSVRSNTEAAIKAFKEHLLPEPPLEEKSA